MDRRSLPLFTLSLALLSIGMFGFAPGCGGSTNHPTPCIGADGLPCHAPPAACDTLDEQNCLVRKDCQANYAYPECGPASECVGAQPTFEGCVDAPVTVCPQLVCDIACTYGLAHDSNGCEVCACSPVLCSSDKDCPGGQTCLFPNVKCPADARCMAPQGTCGPVDHGCGSDQECLPGEYCAFPKVTCPADAFCAPPRGTCKPKAGCLIDADCGVGRRCAHVAMVGQSDVCVDRTPCTTDGSQCAQSETCAMDPNDPCVNNICMSFLPVQLYCVPGCVGLDEASCKARPDCQAEYEYPRCGNDPTPAYFKDCIPAACPPVMCKVACAHGFKKDPAGCSICQCNDSCMSDGDCPPGQSCVFPDAEACQGSDCLPVTYLGTCNWLNGQCGTDADCKSGEQCIFPMVACANSDGTACTLPQFGMCNPAQTTCTDDSQCPSGQRCAMCPPWADCAAVPGNCVPETCQSDSDCKSGERCNVPQCPPNADCLVASGSCQVESCHSDADCRAGESCVFLMGACKDPTGAGCANPGYGVCNKLTVSCTDDTQCPDGQRCSVPEVLCNSEACPQPIGTCVAESCQTDADCRAGESCLFLMVACKDPAGTGCANPGYGVCNKLTVGCNNDSECASGQHCQFDPLKDCAMDPTYKCGTCQAGPARCSTDSQCQVNERCAQVDMACPAGADCGICVLRPECKSNADCSTGETCQPDPTDVCNNPAADCFRAGRTICMPWPDCG